MGATLRQTVALVRLTLTYWARAGVPNPVRKDQGRRVSGAIFRAAFVVLIVNWGYRVGNACARVPIDRRPVAVAWMLVGLFGAGILWSAMGRVPGVRGVQPPTAAPLLDALPLTTASRVVVGLLERVMVYALTGAAFLSAAPAERVPRLVGIAIVFATTALLVGDALLRLAKVLVAPMRLARAGSGIIVAQLPFLLLLVAAPALSGLSRLSSLAVGWALPGARAIVSGGGTAKTVLALLATSAVAAVVTRAAERAGYDHLDVVPSTRPVAAKRSELTLERVEQVLSRREPGRWGAHVMFAYTAFASSGALVAGWMLSGAARDKALPALCRVTIFIATFGAFVLVNTRATRIVSRDAVARPLLAPLPITPADLLRGKARALRQKALLVAAPSLLLLGVPASTDLRVEIAWRLATMLAAVALAASATVSVAFLTQGLGSVRAFGGTLNLETTLVAIPLFASAAPPYAWAGGISVAALALLALSARRAALRCVRWLDDGEDFARETPVWRALLVYAAFQATQALTQRALVFSPLEETTKLGCAYGVAAVVLAALTAHGRRDLPPMRIFPERRAWIAGAVVLGIVSGGVAVLYLRALRSLDVDLPLAITSGGAPTALVAALFVVAPFAEELFFRGWLQSAIASEMGERRAALAPFVTAFVFAAVQPPLSFAPAAVLGIATGLVSSRTRAIGLAVIAHAAHDGVLLACGYR